MTPFWTLTASLITAVLVLLLQPLLFSGKSRSRFPRSQDINSLKSAKKLLSDGKISQTQLEAVKQEISETYLHALDEKTRDKGIPKGWWLSVLLALVIPVSSWQIYKIIGSPGIIPALARHQSSTPTAQTDQGAPAASNQSLMATLQERVQVNPADLEAWVLMARMYQQQEDFDSAINHYQKAMELAPEEPVILVELAETYLFQSADRSFSADSRMLLRQALVIDSENQKALWLLGLDASQHEQWQLAKDYWTTLIPLLPADSTVYAAVLDQLKEIYQSLGEPLPESLKGQNTTSQTLSPDQTADASISLNIVVTADEQLKDSIPDNAMLFVYAKATDGPPMPVAAKRLSSQLPITVTLTNDDSLLPQLKLSDLDSITIGARVSLTGSAMPQSGDMQATEISGIELGSSSPFSLSINQILP